MKEALLLKVCGQRKQSFDLECWFTRRELRVRENLRSTPITLQHHLFHMGKDKILPYLGPQRNQLQNNEGISYRTNELQEKGHVGTIQEQKWRNTQHTAVLGLTRGIGAFICVQLQTKPASQALCFPLHFSQPRAFIVRQEGLGTPANEREIYARTKPKNHPSLRFKMTNCRIPPDFRIWNF